MRKKLIQKRERLNKRRMRIRGRVGGSGLPRLSVFRSCKHVWAQVIDDVKGRSLVVASTKEVGAGLKKLEQAERVGKLIAERAVAVGIKQVVYDRGGYRFHGRVKAVAEEARKGGLKI